MKTDLNATKLWKTLLLLSGISRAEKRAKVFGDRMEGSSDDAFESNVPGYDQGAAKSHPSKVILSESATTTDYEITGNIPPAR